MSDRGHATSPAFFTTFCHVAVEVRRDTFVGCALPAGHAGPHKPPPPPKQVAT